jgi:hypothetical protein
VRIVAWTALCIILGIIIGLTAIILPPIGNFGIVAAAGVILLWAMDDYEKATIFGAVLVVVAFVCPISDGTF